MSLVVSRGGLFFKLNGNKTEWVTSMDQATVFATPEAFVQCCAFGRIAHLKLKFWRWV